MANTFIYALCEPGTRTVRYIGKADQPSRRLRNHLTTSSKAKTRLGNWLRSLETRSPSIVVLREVPADSWQIAEERFIRLARGCGIDLVNGTDGGDGGFIPASHTPEADAKRSVSMKGRRPSAKTLAASQSPEAKARRKHALRGHRPSELNRDSHFQKKRLRAFSRFLGVSWHKGKAKWRGRIFVGNKEVSLSYFDRETDAARAYDAAALRFFGPTTRLNFMV